MSAFNKVVLNETDNSVFNSVSNSTVAKEMEKFNNSYSVDKAKDLLDAYDSISVSEDAINENVLIKTNALNLEKASISFKQKLFFVSASLICAIMLFLAIFNIFVINGMDNNINILQDNIAREEKTYYDLYKDWSTATNNTNVSKELGDAGYTAVSEGDIISVEVGELSDTINVAGSTNWFDSFCNFISSIFGR